AFSAILGGKGGDIYNVWETGAAASPLVLDGQQGSDVYKIFGYDNTHALSTTLNVKINDTDDAAGTGTWTKGASTLAVSGLSADQLAGLFVGERVSGAGLADGTIITKIAGTTLTLSLATAADGTSVALSFNQSNPWDH